MWLDEYGFKQEGNNPYEQRKLAKLRAEMSVEEKYKEKVEEACRWLNSLLYSDTNTGHIRVLNPDYQYKEEIIDEFRKMMQLSLK